MISSLSTTILVIDNLSPFTRDIIKCLDLLKIKYAYKKFYEIRVPIQNLEDKLYSKIILSGRQIGCKESNAINSLLIRTCAEHNIPMLGICFGAQIIALTFGGTLTRVDYPNRRMLTVNVLRPNPLVPNARNITVFESHAYNIARLPNDFVRFGSSLSCQNEIISHKSKMIFGVQFHPERSGRDGLELIRNFVKL